MEASIFDGGGVRLALEQLHKMTKTKAISLSTQVCTQGESEWKPLYSTGEEFDAEAARRHLGQRDEDGSASAPPWLHVKSEPVSCRQDRLNPVLGAAVAPRDAVVRREHRRKDIKEAPGLLRIGKRAGPGNSRDLQ